MAIWTAEIKELETLYESFKGQLPVLEKELERLIKTDDENIILVYARRCLEVIITDLCECELKRPRKTEPLKGIIDKLHKEGKVPSHILTSMHGLNELSTYGAHPKDFDPEQIKPVLVNLDIIIKWYLKYKEPSKDIKAKLDVGIRQEIESVKGVKKNITISRKRLAGLLGRLIGIIASVFAVLYFSNIIGGGKQTKELEKSIAVLPFLNESPVDSNKYFINGIMEEVLTNLQKIKDFRVLSRTSTDQYKGPDRPTIPEIAKKLGVNFIIEGSGQKIGNKFRLRVQLIRAKGKETHLWAKPYEQDLRDVNDLFSIQIQIAEAIAAELKVIIKPEEKILLQTTPTFDLKAHDYYLRGKEYRNRSNNEVDIRYAMSMYEKAVQIDPNFTLAWVGLAECSRTLFWYSQDLSEENLSATKKYLDKALSLSPELMEVQLEDAYYYYHIKLDYSKSLEIAERLKTKYPNDDEIYYLIANLYRRTGIEDYRKSLENYEYAASLNPSIWNYWTQAAITAEAIREYAKAENFNKRAIDLNPSYSTLYSILFDNYVNKGHIQEAKEFLITNEKFFDTQTFKLSQARLEILSRNYDKAIQIYNSLNEDPISGQRIYYTKHRLLGQVYRYIPNYDSAASHFKTERNFLLKKIKDSEYDPRLYKSLGIAYAGLGMKEQALEAIRKVPENNDFAVAGVYEREMDMVRILVIIGEYDEAMQRLDQIMKNLGFITPEILKLDPFWDPVRNEEKFKEIIRNPAYKTILYDD
jgi:TolB-like protein